MPIQTLAFGGKGVARLHDFVIFVDGAVPGDIVTALVTKTKKRYAEARVTQIVSPSQDRVAPSCQTFGNCGGCVWQNLDYGVQLQYKARQVAESLEHLGGLGGFDLRPAVGMAHPWRYRNRVDFSIGSSAEGAVIGFRPPGRWDLVLPLSECRLVSAEMEAVRATVETWLRDAGLQGWDPRVGTGFARHLLVRSAQMGRELLVSLVTAPGELPAVPSLADRLRRNHPQVVGIAHAVNEGRAELSAGLEYEMLWGRPYLIEEVAGIRLKISLNAFFQTNTLMAHVLYGVVAEEATSPVPSDEAEAGFAQADRRPRDVGARWPDIPRPGHPAERAEAPGPAGRPVIWDLYSGVGSIGLSLARVARGVLGIEAIPEAVADARENAASNGIENVAFLEGDVRKVLREVAQGARTIPAGLENPDVVVVDPPRAGLHQRVVARIAEVGVPRIVYVSCNPTTMAPNVAQFQELGYRLRRVTPVDMFPHTPHVEAVGLLTRD
ncbi:MAG: class I SAM-dependent RNA methyltransferase [Actinobacteria bacterium]|nr:class I SAM-dependent RNA methyltransferase [Actinomycetota bacterium]